MREAIKLARKSGGRTRPNPQVGAVVVKGGKIVGKGCHKKAGLPHAENEAINDAKNLAKNSQLYVTLEPCVHFGRTPPCVDAIIKSGIKNVYVGTLDPNPIINGKGVEKLRAAGIYVECGILEEECRALNEGYNMWVSQNRPFVTLKIAATLDRNVADFNFKSKWITGEDARKIVHKLRAASDAVLVGIGTVLIDDPLLTARGVKTPKGQPMRIVLDDRLKISEGAKILGRAAKTLIVTSKKNFDEKKKARLNQCTEIIHISEKGGFLDMRKLLNELKKREIQSLLVEGGATIFSNFIKEGLWDRLYLFVAPKILGRGISWSKNIRLELDRAKRVKLAGSKKVGEDLLLILEREG